MKINENVGTGRKRRKIIYFYEKILKNEKCAVFISDHDPALFPGRNKNYTFFDRQLPNVYRV